MTGSTDTMFSNSKSRQGNKASQVFCTAYGCTIGLLMAKEKDAYEALSLIFHRDGVPNVMVMSGAKVQIQGGSNGSCARMDATSSKQSHIRPRQMQQKVLSGN
jgi:hypothetical protein